MNVLLIGIALMRTSLFKFDTLCSYLVQSVDAPTHPSVMANLVSVSVLLIETVHCVSVF